MTTPPAPPSGLRERKKQATRQALREAALRLAEERGPDGVRVEDIAEAAGVSPRTYNNYFASREQAIVSAVTADRDLRLAAAVAARPAGARLADAVTQAVIEQYTTASEREAKALLLVTTQSGLRDAFLAATADIEPPLAAVLAERLDGSDDAYTARVLAAGVAAAVRIALDGWLRPAGTGGAGEVAGAGEVGGVGEVGEAGDTGAATALVGHGLLVPSGGLADRLRAALDPLVPAFDAAEQRARG
ncbi:TetR/AcrR family transcriptional regulator [Streptomyces sp. NPDC057682]|uniref:TetR/AcrR family transcriptional regulator n=1 Tax=Streptomyces sp. NPDC057682 TaxID=3346210 RepID=UPI0036B30A22